MASRISRADTFGPQWTTLEFTPELGTSTNYATGDLMGALLTLSNAARFPQGGGWIADVYAIDLEKQGAQVDLQLFHTQPAGAGSWTDNNAFDPTDADLAYGLKPIWLTAAYSYNDNGMLSVGADFQPIRFVLPENTTPWTSLWAAVVARGAYNAATAADLSFRMDILQD